MINKKFGNIEEKQIESKTPFIDRKNFADIILVLSLLLVSLSVFLIIALTRDDGAFAVVSVDGREVAEYPLSRDGEYSLNGGTNILVIEGGRAYMKSATCPDGLCIHQGKKHRSGERIVCLPNRVMVEIVANGEELIGN